MVKKVLKVTIMIVFLGIILTTSLYNSQKKNDGQYNIGSYLMDNNSNNIKKTEKQSLWIGLGYYYGGFEVNIEYPFFEKISAFGIIGLARNKDFAFSLGARAYPWGKKKWYKPRIGVSYGYNGIFKGRIFFLDAVSNINNITKGINISIGCDLTAFQV